MLRQVLRVRDGKVNTEVEGRVGSGAPADRRFVCALGGAGAESVLSGRVAERLRAEEQLAGSRVGRGSFALWDAVSTGSLALGRERGPGAPERVCEGKVRQPGCGAGAGRDWISEEG